MKTTFLLVFLVSLSFVLGHTQALRGSCLNQVNGLRQEYAQKYNIANMNQLVYDVDWEDNIQRYLEVYGSCEQKVQVQNGMVVMTGTLENDELFNPDSSKMACLKSKCVETGEDLSPNGLWPPGTLCPPDHPSSNNGLCASSSSDRKPQARKNFLDGIDWGKMEFPEVNKCIVGNCDHGDYPPKNPEFPKEEVPSGGIWDELLKNSKFPIRCKRCAFPPCPCFY